MDITFLDELKMSINFITGLFKLIMKSIFNLLQTVIHPSMGILDTLDHLVPIFDIEVMVDGLFNKPVKFFKTH